MKAEYIQTCESLMRVIKKCAGLAELCAVNAGDTAMLAKASLDAAKALQIIHSLYDNEI